MSLDGTRLAVGAIGDSGLGNGGRGNGAVYLFSFTDTAFSGGVLEAILGAGYTGGKNLDLAAQLDIFDFFGRSVSLDGSRLAVGAYRDDGRGDGGGFNYGAVYLFTNAFIDGAPDDVGDGVFASRIGESITITPQALKALLDAGNDVVLQASNDGTVAADILVNNLTGDGGDLTLQAGRSLFVNADIGSDNGNLALIAN